jgi:glyoxylase-like metal-dependent hydrolase (beta-lactamase superfamily II)
MFSDIELILNTHGHFDHTGGNGAIKRFSRAEVLIHNEDAPFLYDRNSCFELYFAPVIKAMGGVLEEEKEMFLEMAGPEVTVDRCIEDGYSIDVGNGVELKAVHLPGHTPGSVGFFWEKEGIFFSGDSAVGLHVEGGKLPIIYDIDAYARSLKRLQEMPIKCLLCSHPYRGLHLHATTIRRGKEVKQYLEDCEEFIDRFAKAVYKAKPKLSEMGFMQAADLVIAGLPREMDFRPMTQVPRPLYSAHTVYFALHRIG